MDKFEIFNIHWNPATTLKGKYTYLAEQITEISEQGWKFCQIVDTEIHDSFREPHQKWNVLFSKKLLS